MKNRAVMKQFAPQKDNYSNIKLYLDERDAKYKEAKSQTQAYFTKISPI